MRNDLYFISMIRDAMAQPNPRKALAVAFHEIIKTGNIESHKEGFQQFLQFMNEVSENVEGFEDDITIALSCLVHALSEPGDEHLREKALRIIRENCEWNALHQEDCEGTTCSSDFLEIVLMKESDSSRHLIGISQERPTEVGDIEFGEYSIMSTSGRLLWQGCLSSDESVDDAVLPRRLRLAADTPKEDFKNREVAIADGEIIISVFESDKRGLGDLVFRWERK